ncbi:hypothetical protein A8C32_17340 [Flavivirga aquatica]|uniref:Uncharacterized protein n=1 Tax=Flavivirga aquatica TaxID=1849968 RepID=A0A1E5T860_9FLAO|nr:hypothetical protein [Flavivirga aquatica]OEK07561.1 hypothetical protein A8C32_17340 [Flavivirga aquatica]
MNKLTKPNKSMKTKEILDDEKTITSVSVTTELELNTAIINLNKGQGDSIINVQKDITLTANTVTVTENMTLMSSNNRIILDKGYSALTISNGAEVFVSIVIDGTGTVYVNDKEGKGTTLIGMDGGALPHLLNGGNFTVPSVCTFTVGTIEGSANVCGVLNNVQPISADGAFLGVGNDLGSGCSGGQVNDVTLSNEGLMVLSPRSNFIVGSVRVSELCSISTNGSPRATLITTGGVQAIGVKNDIQLPGQVLGVNIVGELSLIDGGVYASNAGDGDGLNAGGNATAVTNTSGKFDLGEKGEWNVETYTQTEGTLSIDIPDFTGTAPVLNVVNATIFEGKIEINAKKYFAPEKFKKITIVLIKATDSLFVPNLDDIVQFNGFEGYSNLVPSVRQKGNELLLTISNTVK